MLERLTETFCEIDDFCKDFFEQWRQYLLADGGNPGSRGPECGLSESEIMTIILMYHGSNFRHFKTFYNGMILGVYGGYFPKAPCYDRFLVLKSRVAAPMAALGQARRGRKTGIY